MNSTLICKHYCEVFMDKRLKKSINIKCHSLSGSRIVGEAFLKFLSIFKNLLLLFFVSLRYDGRNEKSDIQFL